MNEQVLLWAIGILVTLAMAALGFFATRLWSHVVSCGSERRHVDARLSTLEADMERAKEDIGTHGSGIRGDVHDLRHECTKYELRISMLEKDAAFEKRISALEKDRK